MNLEARHHGRVHWKVGTMARHQFLAAYLVEEIKQTNFLKTHSKAYSYCRDLLAILEQHLNKCGVATMYIPKIIAIVEALKNEMSDDLYLASV